MSDFGRRVRRKRSIASFVSIALLAGISFRAQALGEEREHSLQGVFCNTEDQADKAVAHMAKGLAPNVAVELVNMGDVVCNYVDLIHYVVERPLMVGLVRGPVHLFKYEATLKAITVRGVVREVRPSAQVFYVTPRAIIGAPVAARA
jgi:hypothetical protein